MEFTHAVRLGREVVCHFFLGTGQCRVPRDEFEVKDAQLVVQALRVLAAVEASPCDAVVGIRSPRTDQVVAEFDIVAVQTFENVDSHRDSQQLESERLCQVILIFFVASFLR